MVQHINQLFPTEQSLAGLDDTMADLTCQVQGKTVVHHLRTDRSLEGVWEAELPSQAAATVCDFQATSETENLVLTDIMFGDMWFCSGQSNMEMQMEYIMNSTEEIEAFSKKYP